MNTRFKMIRKDRSLTQTEFGKEIGVSKDVIANIEYNRVEPTDLIIKTVCLTFNVNEQWLRTGEGLMYRDQPDLLNTIDKLTEEYHLGEYAVKFLKEYIRLDANGRKTVDGYLERVAKSPDDAPEQTVVMRFARSPDGSIPPTIEKMDAEKVNRLFNLPETDENI